MKSYLKEQPEIGKKLKFSVCGELHEGTFDGINFRTKETAYSVLRHTIEWQYI